MKYALLCAVVGLVVLGVLFREDLGFAGGGQVTIPVVDSIGNLGDAIGSGMGKFGKSLGW